MSNSARNYIRNLNLALHPEGGYYKEVFRSPEYCRKLPGRYNGRRNLLTSIYYLLEGHQFSTFHRLNSDEIWNFYDGCSLMLYILTKKDGLITIRLGRDLGKNEKLQLVVSRDQWFAAQPVERSGFSLVGCTVAPGFEFEDFELGKRKELLKIYPQHRDIIVRLTNEEPPEDGPSS